MEPLLGPTALCLLEYHRNSAGGSAAADGRQQVETTIGSLSPSFETGASGRSIADSLVREGGVVKLRALHIKQVQHYSAPPCTIHHLTAPPFLLMAGCLDSSFYQLKFRCVSKVTLTLVFFSHTIHHHQYSNTGSEFQKLFHAIPGACLCARDR